MRGHGRRHTFYRHEDRRGTGKLASINVAREICDACPVQKPCLDNAMRVENGWIRYGIWGGLTALERAELADRPAYDRRHNPHRIGQAS